MPQLKTFLPLVTVIVLGLSIAWRVSQEAPTKIPRNTLVNLLATVEREPRVVESGQVVEIGDAQVFSNLFPRYRVGDRLKINGQVDERGRLFYPEIEIVGRTGGFLSKLADLRNRIAASMASLLPAREATLVAGTVLGVDSIERSFRDELIKTGTIHVVVVSGQNLAIVAGVFIASAKYVGRRQSLFLATLAVFFYALLTGFDPPVVRASIMVLISSIAIYYGREVMAIWSLVIAALIILFFWPKALSEISFQLTFAATLGIMTLGRYLTEAFQGPVSSFLPASAPRSFSDGSGGSNLEIKSTKDRVRAVGSPSTAATLKSIISRLLLQNAAIATSAYLFTLPIILYYFGKVSLLAPFANLLVAEAIAPVMILGFLIAGASLIWLPLAQILAYFAYVPALYFVKVVEVFAGLPVGQVAFGRGSFVVVAGVYVGLLALTILTRKSFRKLKR